MGFSADGTITAGDDAGEYVAECPGDDDGECVGEGALGKTFIMRMRAG